MGAVFETKNLCLYEPGTGELLQMSYLTEVDRDVPVPDIIRKCGGIHQVCFTKNRTFLAMGIYPVTIYYEKNGKTIRSRENVLEGIRKNSGNVLKMSGESTGYIRKRIHK